MKTQSILLLAIGALALVVLAPGCGTPQASAKTKLTESRLAQCGFKIVPASTPQQVQQLQSLPPGKVSAVRRNGKRYYVYPDALQKVLYVGQDAQYLAYQNLRSDLEEEKQYNAISKGDPSVAKYNNEAEILEGNDIPGGWDAGWGSWDAD